MNVALEIAKVVATTIGGELGKDVFVGRLPASKSQDGMVAVAASGGEYSGGSLGNTKLTTELTITVVKADAADLYELDSKLRTALTQLPYADARFIRVSVFPMQDNAYETSELRMGVWSAQSVTLVLKD
jgi:hypothetical protein